MLDIQSLRNDLEGVSSRLAARPFHLDAAAFQTLEQERKLVQTRTQELQSARNSLAKRIGQAKGKGEDVAALMSEAGEANSELQSLEAKLLQIQAKLQDFLLVIPNLPHASVPPGRSADDNAEVRRYGTPRQFDFPVKDHVDLGEWQTNLSGSDSSGTISSRTMLVTGTSAVGIR